MTTEILTHQVIKETAKAVLVAVMVSWGNGGYKEKQIWLPKSIIVNERKFDNEKNAIEVKTWFVNKVENDNRYCGYTMTIEKLSK